MKTKLRLWAVAWLLLATVMGGHAATYNITNAPGWNLIANQLDGANGNGITIVLPPASVPTGSRLMKFNLATKSFNPVEIRTVNPLNGAAIWSPGTNILNPGDGLMFSNASAATLTLTLSGNPHVPVLPLNIGSGLVLVARQTNDIASATNILGFTPPDFTVVYRFNPGAGRDPNIFAPPHYSIFTKKSGAWNPSSPVINVGESVWIGTNGAAPVITFLSSNSVTCPGGTAFFAASATGTLPLNYQWYYGSTAIGPATNSFYSFPATASTLGDYHVVVSNPFGSATSAVVTLSFQPPPDVTGPSNTVAIPNGEVTLTATPNDARFYVYAWYKDGTLLPNETGNTLTIPNMTSKETGNYCVVVSGCGSITNCATVTLGSLPPQCCDVKVWNFLDVSNPGARQAHAMAYDSARGRVVLFGGSGLQGLQRDTWEWDGSSWTLMSSAGPSARSYMAMAYDSTIQRTILFGGTGTGTNGPLADTWAWDGVRWQPIDATGPSARYAHAMAYDSVRKRTVLFGGLTATGNQLGDTWEFDGTKWIPGPTGAPAPSPRAAMGMAYSTVQGQTILFGGFGAGPSVYGDTWQWDGTKWTLLSNEGPSARLLHAMDYDSDCGRVVLFGGSDFQNAYMGDTWEWDGNAWALRSESGPPARVRHAMAYDSAHSKSVLFGGAGLTGGASSDTWLLSVDTTSPQIRSVYAICGESQIVIAFSKPMDPVSAGTASNYVVNCGGTLLPVTQATLSEDGRLVILTMASPLPAGAGCSLFMGNVHDQCGHTLRSAQFGIECDRDTCAKGSGGTEFWLTFPGNYAPDRTNQPILRLWISGVPGTVGSVSMPGLAIPYNASFTIPASGVSVVALPRVADLANSNDEIQSKGIHVTAAGKVSVYGYNHIRYTTDAFLGLSTAILGKIYMVMSYKNMYNSVPELNGSQFAIVATADNTKVFIMPSTTVGVHTSGVPYLINLMRGQTYQLRNTNPAPADLTGTIILSDQPIAVFGGHQCANLPNQNTFFCNYLVEQIFPADMAGNSFLTLPLATRNGDTFRFLALFNNTTVSVNGVPLSGTINQGKYREVQLFAPSQVTSDKPILVAQFANSSDYDLVRYADPFMVMIPPTVLYSTTYTVRAPTADFPTNYINVIATAASVGSVTLDGAPIAAGLFSPIGASGYSGAKVPVGTGSHTLNNGTPFGVVVYGWAEYDAYGYPGGTCISKQGQTPPRFICPPETLTLEAGTGCVAPVPDLLSMVGNGDFALFSQQSPPAGTLVGPGTYNLAIVLIDQYGNRTLCLTALTVQPSKNPGLQCPQDIITNCTSTNGAIVNFTVTVCNTNYPPVVSTPASGSLFPPGVTIVTNTVSLDGRVSESCTFTVTVRCSGNLGPPVGIASVATPGTLHVTFPEGYQLQKANTVTGPWITISNVVSPAVLPASGKQGYFRIVQ